MTYQNIPIEVWFLDLMDGTLDEEVKLDFLTFCLINNIEIPETGVYLPIESNPVIDKEFLLIPDHENLLDDPKENLIIAYSEGLLSKTEASWVKHQIRTNRAWGLVYREIKRTYLLPETVAFPDKVRLYKAEKKKRVYPAYFAAAALLFGFVFFLFNHTSSVPEKPQRIVKTPLKKSAPLNSKQKAGVPPHMKEVNTLKRPSYIPQIAGIVEPGGRDCILHPDQYSKEELATGLMPDLKHVDSLVPENDKILPPSHQKKKKEISIREWLRNRAIERIFKRQDEALVFQSESRWFRQSVGFNWERQNVRTISQLKLGPFTFEWNKKNRKSNFLSELSSNN